jgi:membrane protease YdiL (CAAX protease family)
MNTRLAISLAVFVGWLLITLVGGQIHAGHGPLEQGVTRGIGWPFLLAAVFLLVIAGWQNWRDLGLHAGPSRGSLWLAWLPLLYIVVGVSLAATLGLPPTAVILWILLNTFLIGLSEELMFRGVLLQAFRHTVSIWPAVLLTTVAFGAVHALNVFSTGDLRGALVQSLAAAFSGLLFIALRLRTGSLWPCIVIHALWDFATFLLGAAGGETRPGAGDRASTLATFVPVLLVLPNAIYGLWLMRHIGTTQMQVQR